VLLLVILLALGLAAAYLHQRGRLASVRPLVVPLTLVALFGTLDGLVTLSGTYYDPWSEGTPALRAVLMWGGWLGLCLWSMLWVFAWVLLLDGLASLRLRLTASWARDMVGGAQLYIFYTLAVLHASDVVAWIRSPALLYRMLSEFFLWLIDHAPGLLAITPVGYELYVGLVVGALAALIHGGGAAAARKMRTWAGHGTPAPSSRCDGSVQ
jgi:hypothetical protein